MVVMENIGEMTINAMFYLFFVALSGGLGLVTAGLIGYKLFKRSAKKEEMKKLAANRKKNVKMGV